MIKSDKEQITERRPSMEIKEQILRFISEFTKNYGYAPTVREIGDAVHLKSTSSVQSHLDAMEEMHLIRKGNKPRTIRILDERYKTSGSGDTERRIPIVKAFTDNLYSKDNIAGYISVPKEYLEHGTYAAVNASNVILEVSDIVEDDLLLVRFTDYVKDGKRAVIKGNDAIHCLVANHALDGQSVIGEAIGLFRHLAPTAN